MKKGQSWAQRGSRTGAHGAEWREGPEDLGQVCPGGRTL